MKIDEFKDIRYEKNDGTGIVRLTINRPERKNALTTLTFLEMWWAADIFHKDDSAGGMLITGAPGINKEGVVDPKKETFSSGGYFSPTSGPLSADDTLSDELKAQIDITDIAQKKLTLKMWALEKPVISAINGYAIGGGFTMPLACTDLIYMSEYAWAQLPFVSIGIIPEFASSFILPRLVGFQKAKEIMLFGEKMSAQQLLDMGLINGVVPHDELISYAENQLKRLIPPKGAGLAVRMTKKALHKPLIENFSTAMDLENEALNIAMDTHDLKEAIMSRVERRAPKFKGC